MRIPFWSKKEKEQEPKKEKELVQLEFDFDLGSCQDDYAVRTFRTSSQVYRPDLEEDQVYNHYPVLPK